MPTMPSDLQTLLHRLENDFVWLWVRWINFRQLFAEGPEQIDLLNWIAPSYFGTTQVILLDDLALGLSRITNRAQTAGRDNLSLERLILGLNAKDHADLIADLRSRLPEITATVISMRDHRNQRVAHLDLAAALSISPEQSIGFSRQTIADALRLIGHFLNRIHLYFEEPPVGYEHTFPRHGDAAFLVSQLRTLPRATGRLTA